MSGGFAVEALLIAFALLAVGLFVWNMVNLIAVMTFRADSKAGRLIKVKAVIKRSVPSRLGGSSRAVAEYSIGERKLEGRMICASGERLTKGQTVKVLVSERRPGLFAVDEQQIEIAVPAHVIMPVMLLIIAAFLVFVICNLFLAQEIKYNL